MNLTARLRPAASALALAGLAAALAQATPAAAQYNREISHDPAKCRGNGPAVRISVTGVKRSSGKLRVQLYRATKQDWLETGRWLNRMELPARAGTMSVCMPVPAPGTYGIAIRHDVNGNNETDLTQDGGGASNNPSFNIFNLGKPSHSKVGFAVGQEVKAITIRLHYL
ncbi:MAG TPA: DUF2141 domain-containing protein [Croceibacterium sp.]|nr:DUF2141 domain-containing protein [Croceibacterium sp.]